MHLALVGIGFSVRCANRWELQRTRFSAATRRWTALVQLTYFWVWTRHSGTWIYSKRNKLIILYVTYFYLTLKHTKKVICKAYSLLTTFTIVFKSYIGVRFTGSSTHFTFARVIPCVTGTQWSWTLVVPVAGAGRRAFAVISIAIGRRSTKCTGSTNHSTAWIRDIWWTLLDSYQCFNRSPYTIVKSMRWRKYC